MSKEEILAGLKQAIQRGYSLELAEQSFINAGYNPREVEEAASEISGILTKYPQFQQQSQQIQKPRQFQPQFSQQKPKTKIFIIILVSVLLILIAGLIGTVFFKTEIINFVNKPKIINFINRFFP